MPETQQEIIVKRGEHDSLASLACRTLETGMGAMGRQQPHLEISDNVSMDEMTILKEYLENLEDETRERIKGTGLTINDYLKDLGIGLLSANIRPKTDWVKQKGSGLFLKSNSQCPTVGVRPKLQSGGIRTVGFEPDIGELLIALKDLTINRFSPEEFRSDTIPETRKLHPYAQIAAAHGQLLGLPLDIFDPKKFESKNIPFARADVTTGDEERYFCQYLIREAIRKILEAEAERAETLTSLPRRSDK